MDQATMNQAIIETWVMDEAEKEYKGKWRNLWFLDTGESYFGCKLYDSEIAAVQGQGTAYSSSGEAEPINPEAVNRLAVKKVGRMVLMKETTHAIPMPVGDK
jgi:hypothetical protein